MTAEILTKLLHTPDSPKLSSSLKVKNNRLEKYSVCNNRIYTKHK